MDKYIGFDIDSKRTVVWVYREDKRMDRAATTSCQSDPKRKTSLTTPPKTWWNRLLERKARSQKRRRLNVILLLMCLTSLIVETAAPVAKYKQRRYYFEKSAPSKALPSFSRRIYSMISDRLIMPTTLPFDVTGTLLKRLFTKQ